MGADKPVRRAEVDPKFEDRVFELLDATDALGEGLVSKAHDLATRALGTGRKEYVEALERVLQQLRRAADAAEITN